MAKKSSNTQNKANGSKPSSLASMLKDVLSTPAPKDFDPEDVHFKDSKNPGNIEDDSDVSEDYDSDAGREHYLEVGKGHLRDQLNLHIADDPKYRGSKSSRSAIYEDSNSASEVSDDDDPIQDSEQSVEIDEDEEISGDSEEVDSELEEDNSQSEPESQDDFEAELDEQDTLAAELREAEEEEKQLLSQLAKKATSDATKGLYVKKQLALWESTLDLRIRLQKLITLTYPLPQSNKQFCEALSEKEPALLETVSSKLVGLTYDLLDTRQSLWPVNNDDTATALPKPVSLPAKRTYEDISDLDELWKTISNVSESSSNYCKNTIEKWSNKVRMSEGALAKGKKFKAIDQSFLHQVQSALADKDRVLRRSQLKRTSYNVIGQDNPVTEDDDNHDPEIYDDGDFYQQLLREFIESRMVDNDDQAELDSMRWAALKKDKQRKNKTVDTRASKGRKLRYHVHEPLQSFMAPIPTQQWHSEMVDELYSSLFQTTASNNKESAEDIEIPNDGLRIFG